MINCSEVIINWFTHGIYSRRKFRIRRSRNEILLSHLCILSDAIGHIVRRFAKVIGRLFHVRRDRRYRRPITKFFFFFAGGYFCCQRCHSGCACVQTTYTKGDGDQISVEEICLSLFLAFSLYLPGFLPLPSFFSPPLSFCISRDLSPSILLSHSLKWSEDSGITNKMNKRYRISSS